jgi:CRP-like cAMP-binding protein
MRTGSASPAPSANSAGSATLALIRQGLHSCSLFAPWPELVIDRIARIARLAHYERGAVVMPEDRVRRDLKLVVSGRLAVSGVNAGGAKFMLSLIGPGEIVGLVRLLKQGGHLYDYEAHDNTMVIHLPCEAVEAVLDQTPALWKDVAFLAMERQRDSIVAMQRGALGGVQQRVAMILVQVAKGESDRARIGKGGRAEPQVLRLSQSDLAHMVSVSRQTINKEIGLLARKGIVEAAYGRLAILDMQALRRIAQWQSVQMAQATTG